MLQYKIKSLKKTMPLTETWVDLEIIILDEVKDKYHMMSLICGI